MIYHYANYLKRYKKYVGILFILPYVLKCIMTFPPTRCKNNYGIIYKIILYCILNALIILPFSNVLVIKSMIEKKTYL